MNVDMTYEEAVALVLAFEDAAKAGFGFRVGYGFEAIPGLEDAAADFIEQSLRDQGVLQ